MTSQTKSSLRPRSKTNPSMDHLILKVMQQRGAGDKMGQTQSTLSKVCPLKVSTANTDRPHQRWTRQLLRGSALLSRPSTLKLVSLLLALGAFLRLALGLHPPTDNNNGVMLYRKRGRNHERNCRIPCISPPPPPPPAFCTRLRLQKGRRICGTLRYMLQYNLQSCTL